MKTVKFVELPVTTWNGSFHEGVNHVFNMDTISQIMPNGRWKQTKIIFKDKTEEFIELYYDDVMKTIKNS